MAFIREWNITAAAIRILYVDDEPDLLEIGKMFLELSGDFSVNTIDSASAALELLKKEQFDAIISDYQMPGMDGIQFLTEVRTRFSQIPFILFTGRGREEIVIKAINSGADLYLQKGGETGAQYAELAQKTRIVVERHAAVEALKKSEEKYRSLIEHADEAIVVAQDGMLRLVNKRAIELIGYPEQNLLSMSFIDVIHTDDRAMVAKRYQKRLKGEELPSRYTFRISPKDGSVRWVEISAVVIDWDGVPATLNYLTDITDRKRAEDALQTAHDNLEVLVQERTADLYSANMKLKKAIEYSNVITESLKEYSQMTSTLNEVVITANKADTLPHLFRDTLDKVLAMMDFEAGGIYLVDPVKRTAVVHYYKNLPDEFVEKSRTIPIDAPPYDTLFIRNQPFITEHFEKLSPEFAEKYHFRSLASIPLVSKNKVIGALYVVSTKRYSISADETKMLTAIGCELGNAITRMIAEDEVKKISLNFQTLFASVKEMVFVLDMQGRIISVNDSVLKRLLYTPAELTGMNVLLLHVPERRDEALLNVQGMIAGTIDSCPVPLISKDGTRIEVETTVTRGLWNSEEVIIVVARDVTERKKADEEIKRQASLIKSLLDSIPDIIFFKNLEGVYLGCNPPFAELVGKTSEEIVGRTDYELFDKEIADFFRENDRRMLELEKPRQNEEWITYPDGRIVLIDTLKTPYWGPDGTLIGLLGISRDITGRKRAEELLNDNYQFMKTLIQTIPIPVFTKNRNGIYTDCNKAFEIFFGRTRDEIIGKTVYDVAPKEIAYEYFRTDEELILHPGTQHYEWRVVAKNGQTRDVIIDKATIMNSDSEATGIIGVMFDITERKRAEAELLLTNKKNANLVNLSRHDTLNKLTGILGYLDMLKSELNDPTLEEYFQTMATSAKQILVNIRSFEQISVNASVWQDCRTLVDTAAKQTPLGKIMVKNMLPAGAEVLADPLIVKVFYNLMDNAVRYGGKITTLRFFVEEHDGVHVMVCEDDGDGVVAEEKEKIFERGFGKNTGLGLAIAREILDITGITIRETGEPGKGARFEMTVLKGAWRNGSA